MTAIERLLREPVDRHVRDNGARPVGRQRSLTESTGIAGRVAAILLVLAGLVTVATVGLPEPAGFDRTGVLVVGVAGMTLGALLLSLPWHRWPVRASLVLVVPALGLIALHNWFGGQDAYRYSIFFLVVFVWVGTFHPRGTAAWVALPTAVAYLGPLLAAGASASALASAGYAIPLFVVVGEILAWRTASVGRLEEELRAAALLDPLTGLANRRLAVDRLRSTVARAARERDFVHVLYVDIDNFKAVNDSCGHDAGDALLVSLAETLTDVVRPSDLVARFAGDEFIVVIESPTREAGRQAAERVVDALHASGTIAGIVPTVSIGVATEHGCDAEPDALLRAADCALYAAKLGGKDQVCDDDAPGAVARVAGGGPPSSDTAA